MMRFYTKVLCLGTLVLFFGCAPKLQTNAVDYVDYQIAKSAPVDSAMLLFLSPYRTKLQATMGKVIGVSKQGLSKKQPESTIGNFMADAMKAGAEKVFDTKVAASFVNYGGVRSYFPKGDITIGLVYELMPFDNMVVIQQLSGTILQQLLDKTAADGGWPIAGITMEIKDKKAVKVLIAGKPLDASSTYMIANSDYVANGGSDCSFLKPIPQVNKGYTLRDALIDQIKRMTQTGKTIDATFLHTNDVHSRLDPFPMDGSRNQGMGGVAARLALINKIRQEVNHILLLDAGDIFQGTPYFNLYKGEPEIKAMTMMGYDACTMGNHDFDGGIENFANQLQHASFPVLVANYDFTGTALESKIKPYQIFQKGKIKVGVFGVGIELQGLVPENLYEKTVYQDPIIAANNTASLLKKKGCNLIICLSHLGDKYDDGKISDEILAKESYNIDLIIGGHTHRFFEAPRKYFNKRQKEVLVNQVGWAGIQLGRLDYNFSSFDGNKTAESRSIFIGNINAK